MLRTAPGVEIGYDLNQNPELQPKARARLTVPARRVTAARGGELSDRKIDGRR